MKKNIVLNNFNGEKTITSYDSQKIWVVLNNGTKFLCKQTKINEMNTNLILSQKISNKKIIVKGNVFELSVPFIYDWNESNGILTMEYCDGINLEFILRDRETYDFGVDILNKLLSFFIDNGIYWIDFAPRNVLINGNKIIIVDFEKGLGFYNDIKDYLRNHVYEEYGSFCFMKDRLYMTDDIFDLESIEQKQKIYYIPDIGPRRIKAMAKLLGYKNYLTQYEYLQIIKTFIVAEEPQIINNDIVFPRVKLEQILMDKNINPIAFDNYALEVLRINEHVGNQFIKKVGR